MAAVRKASMKKISGASKVRIRCTKLDQTEEKFKVYVSKDATVAELLSVSAEQIHVAALKLAPVDGNDGTLLNGGDLVADRIRVWKALSVKKPFIRLLPSAITSTSSPTLLEQATQGTGAMVQMITTEVQEISKQVHTNVMKVHDKFQNYKRGPVSGVVKISIIQGRNLVSRDSNGFSDPYVIVSAFDQKLQAVGKAQHTEVINKSLNPKWKTNLYSFEVADNSIGFTFTAWDDDGVLKSDDFLGTFNVPLDSIPRNTPVEHWFPLHKTEKYPKPITGELLIRFTFETTIPGGPDPADYKPKILTTASMRLRAEHLQARQSADQSMSMHISGKLHLRCTLRPPMGQWEGSLYITVVEGEKLDAKDFNGLSDPYVILELSGKTCQTSVKKKTYNESFRFYLTQRDAEVGVVHITVKDWDIVGGDDLIGSCALTVSDMVPEVQKDVMLEIRSKEEKELPKKIGESMRKSGFRPGYPIVIVPGLASSSLVVSKTNAKDWHNERVWLSLGRLGSVKIDAITAGIRRSLFPRVSHSTEDAQLSAEDKIFRSEWIRHLCLQGDLCEDPPNINVRAMPGKAGCSYLDPGAITGGLSYVMGPLIENLHDLGYTDANLKAAPYDWRCHPTLLEERDKYFSSLFILIEETVKDQKLPVVVLCHSMGNRIFQYFLNWVVGTVPHGRVWLDRNVHTFMAVGAPFLGAPKTVRGLVTGERMGLDTFLSEDDGITFCRSLACMPLLYPMALQYYFSKSPVANTPTAFEYFDATGSGTEAHPMSNQEMLNVVGAKQQLDWADRWYRQNPYFGGHVDGEEAILRAPPVKRLYAIYGINLETEFAHFYRHSKSRNRPVIDTDRKNPKWDGYFFENVRDGIAYETEKTLQPCIELNTGLIGRKSGDGTVPYASLSYCFQWVKDIPTLKVDELDKHRSILNNREFFQRLISYVAVQDQPVEADDDAKNSIDQPIGDVDIDFTKLGITPQAEPPQKAA